MLIFNDGSWVANDCRLEIEPGAWLYLPLSGGFASSSESESDIKTDVMFGGIV